MNPQTLQQRLRPYASRATLVWLLLALATLVSVHFGGQRPAAGRLGVVIVLVIAFVKVRVVGTEFMELRVAPRWLRLAFDAWAVAVCAALVGLYLYPLAGIPA